MFPIPLRLSRKFLELETQKSETCVKLGTRVSQRLQSRCKDRSPFKQLAIEKNSKPSTKTTKNNTNTNSNIRFSSRLRNIKQKNHTIQPQHIPPHLYLKIMKQIL